MASVRHVFGPVASRRLGRSLGVDLVPYKTCTYDCIYCQLGRTTRKTLERSDYVPLEDVLSELDRKIAEGPPPDYVTLSGSGEPTLHSRLGEVVAGVKERTTIPLAILTNGSLLGNPEVRRDLRQADVVIPSLDAGSEPLFRYVNRPHCDLRLKGVAEGLVRFREEFAGSIWLEVFLLGGVTALEAEVRQIAEIAGQCNPDRIHLNTVSRPPAEDYAMPVPPERMRALAALFGDRAEVISPQPLAPAAESREDRSEDVLAILRRRPCTIADLSRALALAPSQAVKCVEHLISRGIAVNTRWAGGERYLSVPGPREARP